MQFACRDTKLTGTPRRCGEISFEGFNPAAIALLRDLPRFDEAGYSANRDLLATGVREPGAALIAAVAAAVDPGLTVDRRSSVSPLHNDLRFARPGTPRYKDHLLLTAWCGSDKKVAPTLWIRIDSESAGFASGVPFTPEVRERYREAVAGPSGQVLTSALEHLRESQEQHEYELAGDKLKKVPRAWSDDHPRANLLRMTGFQVRFRERLPQAVASPTFADWCIARIRELVPVHNWLVAEVGPS